MSAPKRWLDTGDGGAQELELLRAGRAPKALDDAARRRSRQRVGALAALPAAAGASVWWPQLALGAAIGAAGTIATMTLFAPASSLPGPATSAELPPRARSVPHASPAPASSSKAENEDVVAAEPQAVPRPAPSASTRAPEEPQQAPPPERSLEQEIQLLEHARRALAFDPGAARHLLIEHEQRFPGGQLRIEREFLMIDALVRLGRRAEAETRARVLEQQAPTTLYGERLDQILRPKQ